MSQRILLLSAYDSLSHNLWRNTLQYMLPEWEWTQLALPPRYFNWRIRGNSLTWAFTERQLLAAEYDLIIATSMVDLSSLRGFIPNLAKLPTLVYFHENQFAYPENNIAKDKPGNKPASSNVEAQIITIYTALCANQILFNSEFNRRTFLQGANALLQRMPDHMPAGLMEQLEQRSQVLGVPLPPDIDTIKLPADKQKNGEKLLNVAWNHRWEFDKGPHLLLQIIQGCMDINLPVRFSLYGQRFRNHPEVFNQILQLLLEQSRKNSDLSGSIMPIPDRHAYLESLAKQDVVLSTAEHDFQGLAIQEACMLGCTPICTRKLAYPEYLEEKFLYTANNEAAADEVVEKLAGLWELKSARKPLPTTDISAYTVDQLKKEYLTLFGNILNSF